MSYVFSSYFVKVKLLFFLQGWPGCSHCFEGYREKGSSSRDIGQNCQERKLSDVSRKYAFRKIWLKLFILSFRNLPLCKWGKQGHNETKYIYFVAWLSCHPIISLQWGHNGRYSVSNHQPHDCLLNHLFRRRSNKTSKFRVTGLCAGNSTLTGEFPAHKWPVTRKKVSIWWRHHGSMRFHKSCISKLSWIWGTHGKWNSTDNNEYNHLLSWTFDLLSMLDIKLFHVNKWGPRWLR